LQRGRGVAEKCKVNVKRGQTERQLASLCTQFSEILSSGKFALKILDFTFVFAQTFTALFDDQFRSLNDDMNGKNVAEESRWQKKCPTLSNFAQMFSCMEDLNPNTICM